MVFDQRGIGHVWQVAGDGMASAAMQRAKVRAGTMAQMGLGFWFDRLEFFFYMGLCVL